MATASCQSDGMWAHISKGVLATSSLNQVSKVHGLTQAISLVLKCVMEWTRLTVAGTFKLFLGLWCKSDCRGDRPSESP